MQLPLLSIIIPVFNAEKYLPECLNSLLLQTYPNMEIIIVNDCSQGNVEEIYQQYNAKSLKPIRYVEHDENKGLFKARLTGAKAANGNYIAFMDSDDYATAGFYHSLIHKALDTGADMVAADHCEMHADNTLSCFALDPVRTQEIDLHGTDILNTLMEQRGTAYSWWVVWNKIYARSLWDACVSYFEQCDQHLVHGEDVLYSGILFANARHFVNIHGEYYHYRRHNEAVTAKADLKGLIGKLRNMDYAFSMFRKLFPGVSQKYDDCLNDFFASTIIWLTNTALSLPHDQTNEYKKELANYRKRCAHYTPLRFLHKAPLDKPPFDLTAECAKPKYKYVSFALFDTLTVRPLWQTSDLFRLMDEEFTKHFDCPTFFSRMREEAEALARRVNSCHGISLEEIYTALEENFGIPHHVSEMMLQYEIALEIQISRPRKRVQNLFAILRDMGKKIVITEDSYLPREAVHAILKKHGYHFDHIFLSHECEGSKGEGTLYPYILERLKISPTDIMHLGSESLADAQMPKKHDIESIHIPRPANLFKTHTLHHWLHGTVYDTREYTLSYLGTSSLLALAANKLWDDPFRAYKKDSAFNGDPYELGYYALGMYCYSLALWLRGIVEKNNYKHIHFVGRDGFLIQKVYNILSPGTENSYVSFSRKALMPLLIEGMHDFSRLACTNLFYVLDKTPKSFFSLFAPILPDKKDFYTACQDADFAFDKVFQSKDCYQLFVKKVLSGLYDQKRVDNYRDTMRTYFVTLINDKSLMCDSGYAGRTESILSRLLGIQIDAAYIHQTHEFASRNAFLKNFFIHAHHDHTPMVYGFMRELLLAEQGPSCVGFQQHAGQVSPAFEKYNPLYEEKFILERIHKGALDFINDIVDVFGETHAFMPHKKHDLCAPLERFLAQPDEFDQRMFSSLIFEDDLGMGKIGLADAWNSQRIGLSSCKSTFAALEPRYASLPTLGKIIVRLLIDRPAFKKMLRKKYRKNPFLQILEKFLPD